jgi:uncharacterized RDD family membrane protein YckC
MSELSIRTTQNVNINFQMASLGDRIFAYIVDLLIKIAYGISVYYVFFYLIGLNDYLNKSDFWTQFAVSVLFYFPVVFYSLAMESLFDGQTFGKKILKIKVVKIDGYQASFGDYLIRWFFRIVDINISLGIIALITVIVNKKNQRFGDITAGTALINLKNDISINHTIIDDIDSEYVPIYPQVIKLSDNDMRIIKENFIKAQTNRDFQMISKLRAKIVEVTEIKVQSGNDVNFIQTVLKDYHFYTQNM